jgi:hypothetical protein
LSGYPDNNPKTQFGLAKCPVHLVPPALIRGAAEAWANGAEKYGPYNWREKMISATVYYGACLRHLTDWYDRIDSDDCAPDSRVHHLKHAVACLGMILDVMDSDLFNDNRPPRVNREKKSRTAPRRNAVTPQRTGKKTLRSSSTKVQRARKSKPPEKPKS